MINILFFTSLGMFMIVVFWVVITYKPKKKVDYTELANLWLTVIRDSKSSDKRKLEASGLLYVCLKDTNGEATEGCLDLRCRDDL